MTNDAPIALTASLLRVERGTAAPEELAAIAVVVACCARRTSQDRDAKASTAQRAGNRPGHRPARPSGGCWAGCWACR